MKPPKASALPGVLAGRNSLTPTDQAGEKAYPTVAALLQPLWRDGRCTREAGSIRLRIVGPYFLVSITCPTEGLETTATLASIVGLMDALEKHVNAADAVWTPTFDRVKKAKADVKEQMKQEAEERKKRGEEN